MQAVQIFKNGGPEVLTLVELPDPVAAAGEALIRIEASGVNFIDTYFREGRYPAALPYTLGQEAAGTIVAVGPGVTEFAAGDRVAWCGVPGTYATLAVAPVARLIKIPDGISTEQAAAAILRGMTAHYLLHSTFAVQTGQKILIHAGAGGTGLILIQLAKRLGAHVITTVSTDEKAALAREAGADDVILYTREDLVARVKELTAGAGLPVVYDSVGKTTFEQSLQCLKPRGMLVLFGGASGAVPPFDLIRLSTMGSLYVTRPTLKDYISTREDLEWRANEVFSLVADGALKDSHGVQLWVGGRGRGASGSGRPEDDREAAFAAAGALTIWDEGYPKGYGSVVGVGCSVVRDFGARGDRAGACDVPARPASAGVAGAAHPADGRDAQCSGCDFRPGWDVRAEDGFSWAFPVADLAFDGNARICAAGGLSILWAAGRTC